MTVRQDIEIYEGQDFSFVYTYPNAASPTDLTGYSARMAIRRGYGLSVEAYLSDGSDANGGTLTLGGVAGTVTMAMTAAETDDLVTSGDLETIIKGDGDNETEEFIYDLEIIAPGGVVTRILQGAARLHRSVTK